MHFFQLGPTAARVPVCLLIKDFSVPPLVIYISWSWDEIWTWITSEIYIIASSNHDLHQRFTGAAVIPSDSETEAIFNLDDRHDMRRHRDTNDLSSTS